jgi:CHAT domain-containing protein
MDRFYEGLVGMGEDKFMALKFAIQKLKAVPEYSHPYFWAPFFLSGDWR